MFRDENNFTDPEFEGSPEIDKSTELLNNNQYGGSGGSGRYPFGSPSFTTGNGEQDGEEGGTLTVHSYMKSIQCINGVCKVKTCVNGNCQTTTN